MRTIKCRKYILTLSMLVSATPISAMAQDSMQPGFNPYGRIINSAGYIDYELGIVPNGMAIGSLFSAVSKVQEHPATLLPSQSHGVEVVINRDAVDALSFTPDPRLIMPCFDGQSFELAFVYEEQTSPDTTVWYGQIAGQPFSDVILVSHEGWVGAEIRDYKNKRHYQIRPTPDGRQALYEVDKDDNAGNWCASDHGAGNAVPHLHTVDRPTGKVNLRGIVFDPIDQVDFMTIVTSEARAAYGFEGNFIIESQLAISDFNLRAQNSVSVVSLRLVRADWNLAASYSEGSTLSADLAAMRTGGSLRSALDTAREQYRPDLIAMIRQNGEPVPGGTILGLAPAPSALHFYNNENNMSTNARGGSLSLVGDIFAHEVGHNFGGKHDLQTLIDGGDTPLLGQFPAITDSPMGHVITCTDGCVFDDERWHTTMAYGRDTGCGDDILLPYFSRPNFNFSAPIPCGTYPMGSDPFIFVGANVGDLLFLTRNYVYDYWNHATLAWAKPGSGSSRVGNGTNFSPYSWLIDAVNDVDGGSSVAIVRAQAGTYEETAHAGGPRVFNNPTRIDAIDGSVVIR